MEWSFEQKQGAVTVRQDDRRVVCQAIHRAEQSGRYKAWLLGPKGKRFLLGTLIPEGGALRLRRVVEMSSLERQGVWPPTGAEIAMTYAFTQEPMPSPDWCWTECPGKLMGDRLLEQAMSGVRRGLLKRDEEGFLLAFPYSPRSPFPVLPLFCLGGLEQIGEKWYLLLRFSHRGVPQLLHNISVPGENRKEI